MNNEDRPTGFGSPSIEPRLQSLLGDVADSGTIAVSHFSSATLPTQNRHEAWINRSWPSVSTLYETEALEEFETSSATVNLGPLIVSYANMSAQRYERPQQRLRSFDPDTLTVSVMLDGVQRGVMGQREFRAGSGTVLLVDNSKSSSHVSTASRSINLVLPRALAEAHLPAVSSLHGLTVQPEQSALLISHLLQIRRSLAVLNKAHGELLSRTVIDLIAIALPGGVPAGEEGAPLHSVSAIAAREAIEANLALPDLSTAWLCKRLRISRAALYRLFENDGGVQNYIRKRRLEQVRLALSHANTRISTLADQWGFHDAAHLSRQFRATYGMSPTEYRAQFG